MLKEEEKYPIGSTNHPWETPIVGSFTLFHLNAESRPLPQNFRVYKEGSWGRAASMHLIGSTNHPWETPMAGSFT